MLFAFWSPFSNNSNTANTLAVSAALSMNPEHQARSLLLHSAGEKTTMEYGFNLNNLATVRDKGLFAVNRLAKMNLLKPHVIKDYSDSIIKKRLDLLSVQQSGRSVEDIDWGNILQSAKQDYTYVFMDIAHDTQENHLEEFLSHAELVIVSLPQDVHKVQSYLNTTGLPSAIKQRQHVFLLSQYDHKSTLSAKTLNRMPELRQEKVLQIPYVAEYKDALSKQDLQNFFFRTFIRSEKKNSLNRLRKDLNSISSYVIEERFSKNETGTFAQLKSQLV